MISITSLFRASFLALFLLGNYANATLLYQIEPSGRSADALAEPIVKSLLEEKTTKELYIGKIKINKLGEDIKSIRLETSPGVIISSNLVSFKKDENGSLVWKGDISSLIKNKSINDKIENTTSNYVTLIENNNLITGLISFRDKTYSITPLNNEQIAIVTIDSSKFPEGAPPIINSDSEETTVKPKETQINTVTQQPIDKTSSSLNLDVRADDISRINVLMITTPEAYNRIGAAQYPGFVTLATDTLQSAATNSKLPIQYKVTAVVTGISEAGRTYDQLLSALRDPNTPLGKFAAEQRELAQADLVNLMVINPAYCGLAYVTNGTVEQFRRLGFSVVTHTCVSGYTFPHEIGHNLGATHDPNAGSNPYFSYGYGYQYLGNPPWRTVMAYGCQSISCPRINAYSSPNLFHNNLPMGTANQDNVRVLNATRHNAAKVYPNKPVDPVDPVDYDYVFPKGLNVYNAGTLVKQPKNGKIYECRPAPNSGYCRQWTQTSTQYEPGFGFAWREAWIEK
ncbi:M12 family metallo-peptidase [Pectobacterium versatile]|uniref:M12 family metallo-peptidase n=1 Tax=Pectobacterium versatile TaxID=2488639 RepID=UPI001CD11375|nr:M12 family metallo-peptidase [Pectobacterium versatile]